MAFETIQGSYTSFNQVIDLLHDMWEFDSYDGESEYHSVTWGSCKVAPTDFKTLTLYKNGSPFSTFNVYGLAGTYTIAKSNSGITVRFYATANTAGYVFLAFGSGTSLETGTTDKITIGYRDSTAASASNSLCAISSAETVNTSIWGHSKSIIGTQVVPFITPNSMIKADSIYVAIMSFDEKMTYAVDIDGEKYFKNGMLAIKDE